MKLLYITGGKIWLAENGSNYELPSYRAIQYKETIRQIQESKEWKTSGQGALFMGLAEARQDMQSLKAVVCGITPYEDEFLYTIRLDDSGGMYRRNFKEKPEMEGLICSGNDMRLGAIAGHGDRIAACVEHPDGTCHIGLFELPRSYYNEITAGDSVETAPSWSPDGRLLYFTTCGIARDQSGRHAAYSPKSIASYNIHTEHMETVLESEKYDYIAPKIDEAGNLWYIRQPYKATEEDSGNILLDTLLFPVRMVKALGGFLNVFSMRYGGESLRSGGNAKSKQKSEKDLFFEGNLIHAEQNRKANQRSGEEYPALLPHSRVLIRRSPDGTETVLAKGVLDYCLCTGGFVYSNGSHILQCTGGKPVSLAKAELACRLTAIE